MKGYLLDAQSKTIHLVEVGGVGSAHHLIGPNTEGLIEVLRFRNGDAVFADSCGFWNENPLVSAESMGLICSDMIWTDVRPFFSRVLVLGCSKDSTNCGYDSNCDVRSTLDEIVFWTKFFPKELGMQWLNYNYMEDI
jgi:hypothetical protein